MQHYYASIQGWFSYKELFSEMVREAKGPSLFVEIGCWRGKSASFMGVEIINSGKPIRYHVVDHFRGAPNHADRPEIVNRELEWIARQNLAPLKGVVTVLAMSSIEAAATFDDASVSFLFLDGTHDYANVRADLLAWLPKLKPGAIVAGDDANWDKGGVVRAARELLGEIEILLPGTKGAHWRAVTPIGALAA